MDNSHSFNKLSMGQLGRTQINESTKCKTIVDSSQQVKNQTHIHKEFVQRSFSLNILKGKKRFARLIFPPYIYQIGCMTRSCHIQMDVKIKINKKEYFL